MPDFSFSFSFVFPRFIVGTFGADRLAGGRGNDIVFALTGDDRIALGGGHDNAFGGFGDDRIFGGSGDDYVRGGFGDDRLFGQSGDDTLSGGRGDDVLSGSRGDDILRGGSGDDDFLFNPDRTGEGVDTVRDFALGHDKIVLSAANIIAATPGLADAIVAGGGDAAATLAALDGAPQWRLTDDGRGNLAIDHPNGTIVLEGVPASAAASFGDLSAALSVEGLGETLATLAQAAGNPASVAALVAGSGGTPDTDTADFDLLLTALDATDLVGALADTGASLSVFAPTDAAFVSLAGRLGFEGAADDEAGALDFILATLGELGGGDPLPLLTDVLLFHVAPGARTLGELQRDGTVDTLLADAALGFAGDTIEDAEPALRDPTIIAADVQTGNGVVQVIDEVLLPFAL